jgi:serine/threonine protein kinase
VPTRLAPGQRVGERYVLDHELGASEHGVTWQAVDERLDRAVALRVFDTRIDRVELTQRAGVAASLTHPRVVRVFDTGTDGSRFFTVSELLPTSLASVRLPLSQTNAANTAIDVAEALQYAHERGVVHGNLHEGNVLLSESGAKVGDFALSARSESAVPEDDLVALGEMMARVTHPRAPGDADPFARIIEGLRAGAYPSATEALTDLRALRPAPAPAQAEPAARKVWPAIVVAALIAVAAFGATKLGHRGTTPQFVPGGRINGTPLHVLGVHDFDPLGDGHENGGKVHFIHDGQSTTYWTTERYISSADFSGRKSGVGVIFDMGTSVNIGKADVLFAGEPCNFEIRFADTRSNSIDQWQTATAVTAPKLATAVQFSPHTGRYWLLWITRLTRGASGAGSSFACAVAEANLYAP